MAQPKKSGRTNKKLTAAERQAKKLEAQKRREKTNFKSKIRNTFVNAGFAYFNTGDKHIEIGLRKIEIDLVFLYENILLICEDTTATTNKRDHLRNKTEAFREIQSNKGVYVKWLKSNFPEKKEELGKYHLNRMKVFYLYFPKDPMNLDENSKELFSPAIVVEPSSLEYFERTSKAIKRSAKYDIFRFLGLKSKDIEFPNSTSRDPKIAMPVIFPHGTTGRRDGVRMVSFMVDAQTLIERSYVMRKDNWEDSIWLYQRLVEPKKIQSIRKHLVDKKTTFANNIIVALPDDTYFKTENKKNGTEYKKVEDMEDFTECKLILPDEINSICLIDGQHRVYAHYEGNDQYEEEIAFLRGRLHLLVTGFIFPSNMGPLKRSQIQAEVFLDINDNAKKVPANVLLHIEGLKDPFSDLGVARQVVEQLNKEGLFKDMFELSTLESGKIKVASLIKFALKRLVTIAPAENQQSLVTYWGGDRAALEVQDEKALEEYISFAASTLRQYFGGLQTQFADEWKDKTTKILSVTSLNGFIIALTRQLPKNGVKGYKFYANAFKKLSVDFSKDGFEYTSSQYNKFSTQILQEAFGFSEDDLKD